MTASNDNTTAHTPEQVYLQTQLAANGTRYAKAAAIVLNHALQQFKSELNNAVPPHHDLLDAYTATLFLIEDLLEGDTGRLLNPKEAAVTARDLYLLIPECLANKRQAGDAGETLIEAMEDITLLANALLALNEQ